jgi:hypothetical protein
MTQGAWSREHFLPDGALVKATAYFRGDEWHSRVDFGGADAPIDAVGAGADSARSQADHVIQVAHPHDCVRDHCSDWHPSVIR